MSVVESGTFTPLEKVTRCKSDTSTLCDLRRQIAMGRIDRGRRWSWRRDSSKESACTMPALSLRNS